MLKTLYIKMKKILLTLSILTCLTLMNNAQTANPATTASASATQADIKFDKEIHDFGTIPYAGNGTYEFKFKNTGKEPLIISNAQGSCGCTVPTYPQNVPIKSGESNVIKVTYDTKRPGNFTKTVTIYSNAKTPEKVITIKGVVESAPVEETFPSSGKKENGSVPFEKH